MGLLDDLIDTGTGIISSVPIVGPIVAGVVKTVTDPIVSTFEGVAGQLPLVGGFLGAAPPGQQGARGGGLLGDILGAPPFGTAGGPAEGFTRGNGSVTTRTIIETLDLRTGAVTRVVKPGSPHLMNSDVRTARRVIKMSRKLAARIPKETRVPSKMKQLQDAAVDSAMRNVQCPPPGRKDC